MEIIYILNIATLAPRVNLVHRANGKKGINQEVHENPYCELMYILAGNGIIRILDTEFHFNEGDLLFLPPYLQYDFIPLGVDTPHFRLQFSPAPGFEDSCKIYKDLTTGFAEIKFQTNYQQNIPMHISGFPFKLEPEFEALIQNNREITPGDLAIQTLRNQEMIIRILIKIMKFLNTGKPLQKSVQFIEKNYTQPLNLPFLADLEDITPNYYSHLFKINFGLSPVEYITQKRIILAKRLLAEGTRKIKEIAIETGFEDEYYFSKVFKKSTRFSPREYKKLLH